MDKKSNYIVYEPTNDLQVTTKYWTKKYPMISPYEAYEKLLSARD
jgi:hypothetical protein